MDGADFRLTRDLLDRGRLPTLASVAAAGGGLSPLASTLPAITPTAWSSFLTGLNPAGHGIFGFTSHPSRASGTLESAATRRGATVMRRLARVGVRSASIAVPFTYPPDPTGGIVVTGFGGPTTPAIVPEVAARRIAAAHPGLETAVRPTDWSGDVSAFTERLARHAADIADVCCLAMSLEPELGLLCVDFMSTDIAGHLFWDRLDEDHPGHAPARAGDELIRVYEAVDAACGRVIDHAEWLFDEPPTVFILSDHGMRPTYWTFHVNSWLRSSGFATMRRGGRRSGIRADSMRMLDPDVSRAYGYGLGGQVFLADDACDDASLLEDLVAAFGAVRGPSGEPAFDVKAKRELYHGPYLDRAPEIVLVPHDDRVAVEPGDAGLEHPFQRHRVTSARQATWSGHHVPTGIVAAAGPGVAAQPASDAHITQFAATVLALFGVHADCDAGPLDNIRVEPAMRISTSPERPPRAPYTESEEETILAQLRALGYE